MKPSSLKKRVEELVAKYATLRGPMKPGEFAFLSGLVEAALVLQHAEAQEEVKLLTVMISKLSEKAARLEKRIKECVGDS